jgi:hypothetical protein
MEYKCVACKRPRCIGAKRPRIHLPINQVCSIGGIILTGENRRTWRKDKFPNSNASATNPTSAGAGLILMPLQ